MSRMTETLVSLDDIWKIHDELLPKPIVTAVGCKCGNIDDIIELDCYTVCNSCGLILEDLSISTEAEWRSFNNENGMSDTGNRCGAAMDTLAPIHSMATMIAGNSKLAKRQLWSSLPYNERVLYEIKNNLNIIIAANNLPDSLCKNTLILYKKFTNKDTSDKENMNLYRGNNKNTLIAVCFYYAAKFYNMNLTSAYICNIFNVKTQKFSKYCKLYNEHLGNNCDNTVNDVANLCERYTIKLNLSWNIQKLCKKIIQACGSLNILTELAPQSLISGVIYFINIEMQLNLSKNDIFNACDISENTMIKTYRALAQRKQEIFSVSMKL